MKAGLLSLVACLVCCTVGLAVSPVSALGESSGPAEGSGASSSLGGSLVIAESPTEGEEVQAQREAKLSSPEAVAAREASRTKFENLDTEQAAKVAGEAFPAVIDEPAGGPPRLPAGQSITGYLSDNAASVDLGEGVHGVVESTAPIAIETSPGRRMPVDLGLSEVGGAFEPKTPLVSVRISKRVGEGAALSGVGVSLTPVDAQGAALGGSEGTVDGAGVLYANTQTDADTIITPTTLGFDADTMLRSIDSPRELYFRAGLPVGARLAQEEGGGAVRVVKGGVTIATIPSPGAQDATGMSVPVAMAVSGDTLVLSVGGNAEEERFPVAVDPEVEGKDPQLVEEEAEVNDKKVKMRSNWEFKTSSESKFGHEPDEGPNKDEGPGKGYLQTTGTAEYAPTETAAWFYQTRGESKIYKFKAKTEGQNKGAEIESFLELEHSGGRETKEPLSTELKNPEYGSTSVTVCAKNGEKTECEPPAGANGNAIRFQQSVQTKPSNYKFLDRLTEGTVYLWEPAGFHATAAFNTTSPELKGKVINEKGVEEEITRKNVLDGGGWLTKKSGALGLISEDKGIGVSATRLEYESAPGKWEKVVEHEYLKKEGDCKGIQCEPKNEEFWVTEPKLPNGEDKIRYRAEEAMSGTESLESESKSKATVKVDTAKPRGLFLGGLPYGNELTERTYKLTAYATDGEGSTVASPGVASIEAEVENREGKEVKLAKKGGTGECSVSKGECTASVEYELSGAEIGAGRHSIVIVAKDKAGNEAREEEHITVRHSTPVALGPGSVDLESGDFSLGASDVSLGSGLTVSRDSSSRNVTEGDLGPDNGPLGPEWSMSLGTTESLVEIPDNSMLLTDSTGKQTIFAKTKTATYESPPGDSNLKLTVEENKEKTEKLAFYLEDPAAKTKVKFTLPTGSTAKVWMPTIQEGAVPTDAVSYSYTSVEEPSQFALPGESSPDALAAGPGGDVWFSNENPYTIGKITPSGQITEYALPGSHGAVPQIAEGPEGNMWFVNEGPSRIGNVTSTGAITEYKLPSESYPQGIAAGPEGDMWFTESGKNKVGKITSAGVITEYELPSSGSKPGAMAMGPEKEDLWFVEKGTNKIGKINATSDEIKEYGISAGTPARIISGPEGSLWYTVNTSVGGEIGKITPAGTITPYEVQNEKYVIGGLAAGPEGDLWFTEEHEDAGTYYSEIWKLSTSTEVRAYRTSSNSEPWGIAFGADGNPWFGERRAGKIGMMTTSGARPTITAPSEVLAAAPAGVSCSPTMNKGCRAVKFTYAKTTTASGENKSEWGEYEGHLSKVSLDAYNPAVGREKMEETAVADYSYDKWGRLRAEWDPRVESSTACGKTCAALKTMYGYDVEDHVTALDPPGQEPWSFTYGSIAGDAGSGRLMKATRTPASAELWNGELPENTEAPKIAGMAIEGVRLAVSNGKWSGSPMSYGYQWEDCNSTGGECTPILGATNPNYTVRASDVRHTLVAQVTATNGGGSVAVSSSGVEAKAPVTEYPLSKESQPITITAAPEKENYLWFAGRNTNKLGRISTSGAISEYTLPEEGTNVEGITAGPENEKALWFTEWSKDAIGKITTSGTITQYKGTGESPDGITVGPAKEKALWFTEYYANKIGKITTAGVITEYAVPANSEPSGITAGPDGNLWFTENGRHRVAKMTTAGEIIGEYELTADARPNAIVAGPGGEKAVWVSANDSNTIAKVTTSGTVTEYKLPTEKGGLKSSSPDGIAAGPDGNLWFTELGGKPDIGKITTSGAITEYPAPAYSRGITAGPDGDLWMAVEPGEAPAIGKINPFPTEGEIKSPGPGSTIDYGVPLEGSAAPEQMGTNATTHKPEPEKWGQTDDPVEATAIFPPDSPQGWPASSYKRATVYYLDEEGRDVNISQPSTSEYGSVATAEYNEENDVTRTLSADNRATALAAGEEKTARVATLLSTFNTYKDKCSRESEFNEERESSEFGTRLCETEGPMHTVKYAAEGKAQEEEGSARNHVRYFYDEKVPAEGPEKEKYSEETFNLVSETQNLTEIVNPETGKVEKELEPRDTTTSYSGQSNLGWKLRSPTSVVTASELGGAKVEHKTLYVESGEAKGQIKEARGPKGLSGESAHDSRIVYYTAEADKEGYAGCGERPEWAGLVCVAAPVKQPAETADVSRLPVTTTVAYNMWDEPEKVEETFEKTATMPEAKRTKVETYDAAGRLLTSETTSTSTKDVSLPKVTDEYSSSTGVLEKQSTTVSEKTKAIASKVNTLGQLTEYTDADGNVAKYKYAGPEGDGLLEEMSDSSDKGESSQKYKYNETTKEMTELVDSAAGVFTASYDAEGKLTSEVYPNGMCANDSYNAVGEGVGIEYVKSSNCSEKGAGVWFSESRVPSVRGETMSRSSTLASETYGYDTLGRLTETQETPAGEYCKTRVYTYDEESNRLSLVKHEPNSKKECSAEGGTEEKHAYDEGNRLIDSGIEYDLLGNVTKLPAADAEGHELKSTFYVDNAVAMQEQSGTKNEYFLDPDGRVHETVTGAKKVISHYDGSGEAVAWTCEVSSSTKECEAGTYTRNIPGIGGALTAVQANSSGVPVLQLHDLQGDIVATIKDKAGETKLESMYNSTEFGVPDEGKAPPSFAWLGAADVQSSLSSGVITYGATSYVPQTGKALQSEQVEPPGYPVAVGGGTYATFTAEPWVWKGAEREAAEAPGIGAAEEREAYEAACRANPESCAELGDPTGVVHYFSFDGANLVVAAIKTGDDIFKFDQILKFLKETPVGWAISWVEKKLGIHDLGEWIDETQKGLESCLTVIDEEENWHEARCRVSAPTIEVEVLGVGIAGPYPDFGREVEVSYCAEYYGGSGHRCVLL